MNQEPQLKERKQPEKEVQSKEQQEAQDVQQEENQNGPSEGRDIPSSDVPPIPPSMPMIIVLGLIAMLSGVLVVLVYEYTAPIIAEKERLALEAAVFQVIPSVDRGSARQISFSLTASNGLVEIGEETAQAANLYAVYDSSNALLGIAMQGAAQGYQDIVRTLFGYDVEHEKIVGMTVLKSVDTPGLGDKKTVEKNTKFMVNFQGLDVSLIEDKSAISHPIETVKHGTKTEEWQVDAMSGATITSRAIAKGMRDTTSKLLPLLAEHLVAVRSTAVTKVEN
uniref:Ion-translocating oxidoreductase complex subunit G n=1 Tax=Candidatus Kentrum eta TaxID=2126337 RepID=A0A450UKB0_9GAMM|nr:MAG: electron transport complex protein RnfG [Candidatus Kentron sp. H]VFJ93770.1 MAG: electron transport complex protein RnfG [Candidatus Kentron sp. H]VFK00665.1 MAG: electron transport complex protein RnfG [Candidatus Kentron sp. H]